MQILEQFYTISILACLLLFISLRDILSSWLLIWVLLLLLYSGSIRVIAETSDRNTSVFLLMTGYIARSLFIPAAYLYLRNYFYRKQLIKRDMINLLPCAIFCLGCAIAYIINGNLNFLVYNEERHGLPPFSADQVALLCFQLFVWCVTGLYLWLVLVMLKRNYTHFETGKGYVAATGLSENGAGLNNPGLKGPGLNGHMANGHSLNGHNGSAYRENGHQENGHHENRDGEKTNGEPPHPIFLTEEKMKYIDGMVKEFITDKKPFLQHGYSLKQLSEQIHVPLHHLSAFINRYYKMNFNDFINEYRVSFCKVKIMNEEWKYKKLEAIAGESGFSNRNTFTSAFKKATGQNPSVYLKQLKADMKQDAFLLNELEKTSLEEVKEDKDL